MILGWIMRIYANISNYYARMMTCAYMHINYCCKTSLLDTGYWKRLFQQIKQTCQAYYRVCQFLRFIKSISAVLIEFSFRKQNILIFIYLGHLLSRETIQIDNGRSRRSLLICGDDECCFICILTYFLRKKSKSSFALILFHFEKASALFRGLQFVYEFSYLKKKIVWLFCMLRDNFHTKDANVVWSTFIQNRAIVSGLTNKRLPMWNL